jgi:cyclic pyranopterin phosphate synthase
MNRGVYVKVNMVVMKGFNEMEIIDFVAMTQKKPLHVRFIEFMPFDGNSWSKKLVFTESEILNLIESKFDFFKIKDGKNDTARKFKPIGHEGTFAIISSMSHPFCDGCNRIRLTADGKLKNCLFSCEEVDLIEELRNSKSKILIKEKIISCFLKKEKERGGQFNNSFVNTNEKMLQNRSMIKIGG